MKIAPSLLSCDFSVMGQEIDRMDTFDIGKAKICTNEKQIKELYDSFFVNSFREVFLSRLIYEISILIGIPRTRKIVAKLKSVHIKCQ